MRWRCGGGAVAMLCPQLERVCAVRTAHCSVSCHAPIRGPVFSIPWLSACFVPFPIADTRLQIPFTIVFTKLDKRKKGVTPSDDNIAAFEQVGLIARCPPVC